MCTVPEENISCLEAAIENFLSSHNQDECIASSSSSEKISNNNDRINITGNEDGILPSFLFDEAEFELHEKQEWVNRDVEALR